MSELSVPTPSELVETARATAWLAAPVEQLRRARAANRFPTALLIHEQRGAGGEALAYFASQLALCQQPDAPCGQCRDCRQFNAAQHPDFLHVTPIEDSKLIRVEQIRELSEALSLTAHNAGASVALLAPADSMNANAANALLKTLEEPRRGVTLILLTAAPSRLPATILSRCQRLRVAAPARAQSIAWLTARRGAGPWEAVLGAIGNAPFEAALLDPAETARLKAETERSLTEAMAGHLDIPGTAERWARGEGFDLRLACIENWLTARIDGASAGGSQMREVRSGAHLPEGSSDLNIAGLLRVLEGAYELRRLRLTSINRSLALERLLWPLPRMGRAGAGNP